MLEVALELGFALLLCAAGVGAAFGVVWCFIRWLEGR